MRSIWNDKTRWKCFWRLGLVSQIHLVVPAINIVGQALSQFPKYLLPAMLWSERDDAEYLAFRRGEIANL